MIAVYPTIAFVCPAKAMVITPAQLHMHLDASFMAGILAITFAGTPGTQGAEVTGVPVRG